MSTAGNPNEETVPCANKGCHFWGRPSTQNFCSKCFNEQEKANDKPVESKSRRSSLASVKSTKSHKSEEKTVEEKASASGENDDGADAPVKQVKRNRCWKCKKKVGLTGIECRCGFVFCGAHRYSDQHDCQFDFKSFERDAIAKANSKVSPDKLERM